MLLENNNFKILLSVYSKERINENQKRRAYNLLEMVLHNWFGKNVLRYNNKRG